MIRVMAVALLLAGCDTPLATCEPESSLFGTWEYSGAQDPPLATMLSGVLEVTSESCSGFEGSLDLVETRGTGETLRLTGPVAGRLVGEGSLRFDAFLGPVARQHLAALGPGAAEGTWVLAGSGGTASVTGSFSLRRESVR